MDNSRTDEQEQYLRDVLTRSVAYEQWKTQDSFALVKARYENQVRLFSNKAVTAGFKDMEEFQLERGKVLGLKSIFDDVNSALETLKQEREKNEPST